jgi:hypothetical protein
MQQDDFTVFSSCQVSLPIPACDGISPYPYHDQFAEVARQRSATGEDERRRSTTSSTTSPTIPAASAPKTAGEVVRARS